MSRSVVSTKLVVIHTRYRAANHSNTNTINAAAMMETTGKPSKKNKASRPSITAPMRATVWGAKNHQWG